MQELFPVAIIVLLGYVVYLHILIDALDRYQEALHKFIVSREIKK